MTQPNAVQNPGVRQKLDQARAIRALAPPSTVLGAWVLSLARAARDTIGLEIVADKSVAGRCSLAELLERRMERALIILLAGRDDALGLLVISAEAMAGMIEMQTIGRLSATAPLSRLPTQTDAAMVSVLVDQALDDLDKSTVDAVEADWPGGFRYASYLETARPLGLLLEEVTYKAFEIDVSLGGGIRKGSILLAVPADRKRAVPDAKPEQSVLAQSLVFKAALTEQVMVADASLDAVLASVTLPLQGLLAFDVGDQIPLGKTSLDQITLRGLDGAQVFTGKLGQNKGMRAVRLTADKAAVNPSKLRAVPGSALQAAVGGGNMP
jgi:flagellar motor switch protein FliM